MNQTRKTFTCEACLDTVMEDGMTKECAMCKWACLEDAALHCHRHAPRIMDKNGLAVFPGVKHDCFCNEYERKQISQEAK